MSLIVLRRNPVDRSRLLSAAEAMYAEGYGASEIADALNDVGATAGTLPVSTAEVRRWITELHWLRKPEPVHGERLTPEPPPVVTKGAWESPFYQGWMA